MRPIPLTILGASLASLLAGACGGTGKPEPSFDQASLMDPQKCQTCHPNHYKEWSGSMHAYASDDPVFLAMNARAQRETSGAVGDFCVKCHAPMAVQTGATKDGTNLASLPSDLKGVTCYFCHSAASVNGTHDNPIALAKDGVMRAGITNPVANTAHDAAHSDLLDGLQPASATLCGSCHDIVTTKGAHLERTFAEWKGTLFSRPPLELPCGECHMVGREGLAAQAPGVELRRVHSHEFPGVDLALTSFPEADTQKAAVQSFLDSGTLQAALCVKGVNTPGPATIQVVLDNVGAGHEWPSGATQDRRAWVEIVAYAGDQVVYQSGVVPDGTPVVSLVDPDLWLIRDCIFDDQGKQVSMFWQAASFESNQLPGPVTSVQSDPKFYLTHITRDYPRATSTPPFLATAPDRVTMRVQLAPIGLDVLADLVQSGDLDASIQAQMPTFTLAATNLEWTAAASTIKYVDGGIPVYCVSQGLSTGANAANPAPVHTKCSPP